MEAPGDKETWLGVRRQLIAIIRGFDKRFGIDTSRRTGMQFLEQQPATSADKEPSNP